MKEKQSKPQSLAERKHPLDPAPDWIEQTVFCRLTNCVTQLLLFDIISEEEAKNFSTRLILGWSANKNENQMASDSSSLF